MRSMPSAGDIYRHKAIGDVYTIITMTNIDATRPGWPPTVVYEDMHERIWSRPLSEFNEKFAPVVPEEVNP